MSIVFVAETMALSFLPACHAPGPGAERVSEVASTPHAHAPAAGGAHAVRDADAAYLPSARETSLGAGEHPVNAADSGHDHDGATPVDRFACCHLLALSTGLAVRVLPRPSGDVVLPASEPHPSDRIERIERPPRA